MKKGPAWLEEFLSAPRASPAIAWQAWHRTRQAAAGQLPAPIATWYSRSVAMVTRILAEIAAEKAGKMERELQVHAQQLCPDFLSTEEPDREGDRARHLTVVTDKEAT